MNPILIVDDNEQIVEILSRYIAAEGWPLLCARSGEEALSLFDAADPSVILLDILLPGIDGLEVCRRIRRVSGVPILMITARDEDADRILGLDIGADDYIVKPFSPGEVMARIRAVLRRMPAPTGQETLVVGSLSIHLPSLSVTLDGRRLDLTRRDEQHRLAQQRLFSGISHELKTPVTVIRGSLEALRDGVVTGPEAVSAYYAQMIGETRWLQHLIRDLLELSRLQSDDFALDLSPVDLSELLSDVAMSARALCTQKGLTFACEEPSAHPQVMGDYSRLRQMLMIAVDNAVKFTPPGRGVRLWLDEAQRSVSVADEGPGIPAAEVPLIFERFHHTRDPSHEGAGLGLAIAAEIARRHGVTISVASEEGRGTVFTFAFPSNEA